MFSFAVLDVHRRELFLARDFFGIKPMLYATWPGGLAFGSEIRTLFAVPHVSRRVHAGALYDYLQHGLVDHRDQTMFADICHLPAAHYARVSIDEPTRVEPVRYWRATADKVDISFEEATDRVRALFEDSIRLHLRSDVPVGTALSGGIDSSAIVTVMRRVAGPAADIKSFSYLADDPRIDEERWVDMAAAASAADVHKVRVSAHDLVEDLDALILCQGEPFGSTSIYAQHRVFRLAAEAGVPVMLDGQGADELFAGYRSYLAAHLASLLRQGRIVAAGRLARGVAQRPDVRFAGPPLSRIARQLVPARPAALARIAAPRLPAWADDAWFRARIEAPVDRNETSLDGALDAALSSTVLPSLLRYEDRNSMAYSIESRVPFLTPAFAELAVSLPNSYLVDATGRTKHVFRAALRGVVPDAILDRRDKIGFTTPGSSWFAAIAAWSRDSAARAGDVPGVRVDVLRAQCDAVAAGVRRFDWQLWRWLNAVRWADLFDVDFG
jgi:asparagine synthase (glutamine-hydrolysing)